MSKDPIGRFQAWFTQAEKHESSLPEACSLSTVDERGHPSTRMLLCKGVDERGFVFYTNLGSRKAQQLRANPHVEMLFHWKSLKRQVRVSGSVRPVTDTEADAYFASRSRTSQLGAWASRQSQPLPDRLALEKAVARYAARFGIGAVPRPEWWSGFRLRPERMEFWEELPFRLHRREQYDRTEDGWGHTLLFP